MDFVISVLLAGNMVHPLSRYMMGAEGGNQSSCKLASSQESIHRIMQETRDVIERLESCSSKFDYGITSILLPVGQTFFWEAKMELLYGVYYLTNMILVGKLTLTLTTQTLGITQGIAKHQVFSSIPTSLLSRVSTESVVQGFIALTKSLQKG